MKPQRGMVLLLCLIFLTALTLLGLSATAEAILQKKLTSNLKETERARQSALSALSWAEDWLLNLQGSAPEACSTVCENFKLHATGSLPAHPEFNEVTWWVAQGHEAGVDPMTGERLLSMTPTGFNPPMWIIEVAHEISSEENGVTSLQVWYRITARGNGKTSSGVSVVQSVVMRSWLESESPQEETNMASGRVSWRELR